MAMTRFVGAGLLFAGLRIALAAACPAINFYTAPELLPPASGADIVTIRQPDGSFTEYGLGGAKPSFTTPNIQSSIAGCLPASSHTGPRAKINFNPTGTGSEPGAIADLNGNGIPELLIAETNPGLTVFYDFNLAAPTVYLPQVTEPTGVSVADVNGDGHPDVVVLDGGDDSSNPGNVYILLNKGDGTLTPSAHYSVSGPGSVAIADVNGDGRLDLVVGYVGLGAGTAGIAIFLGKGDGTFQEPANYPTASGVGAVAVADFNGDSHPDIVYTTYGSSATNPISILLGDGKGNFTAAGAAFSSGGDAVYVAVGDFNGDGKLDLATGNFNDATVSILLGNGDGSFQAPHAYSAPYGPSELTVTDFNNDGFADILIGVGSPTAIGESENSELIGVLLGNGDGTFQGAPTTDFGTGNATFLAVADFNGDGKTDAVASDESGNVAFFAGKADGTFQTAVVSAGELSNPGSGVVADFNGDGKPDIAVAEYRGSNIFVLLNSGGGNFQPPLTTGSGGFGSGGFLSVGLTAADFNGDGKMDLAVVNSGGPDNSGQNQTGNVAVLTGSGTGAFTIANTYAAGLTPSSIAAGDVNGDGKPDFVVTDSGMETGSASTDTIGAVYVFLNQGGSFQNLHKYTVGAFPSDVAIGDLNGDGRLDLVVATSDENVNYFLAILLGNGDGTFQAPILLATQFGPSSIVIKDFNGDGKPDILVGHCCGDTAGTYLVGHGDGTFDPEVQFNAGPSPGLLAAADINGDGRPDLLAAGSDPASFTALVSISPSASVEQVSTVSSAPAPEGAPVAAESIASAYGSDLANTTTPAETLGTSLGGTTVNLTDSTGTSRPATLFYVSPKQVNFEIPAGTANGTATVTVHSGDGTNSSGSVEIASVAPGLYTANTNSLAAAYAIHYSATGTLTSQQNVAAVNSSNQVVPSPISLDPQGSQVYLLLFGTGLRHAAQSSVTVTIGSTTLTPAYSGAQGGFAGLDQINVLLPYSLKGSGDVEVVVTAAGQTSNTVRITIQ